MPPWGLALLVGGLAVAASVYWVLACQANWACHRYSEAQMRVLNMRISESTAV